MNLLVWCMVGVAAAITLAVVLLAWRVVRRRHFDRWIGPYYVRRLSTPRRDPERPVDVFLAVCDHFEPEWNGASPAGGREKVAAWVKRYPWRFAPFHDERGRPPQHTFFFPQDQYRPEYLDALRELCDAGFGDVDIHLHHDSDTAEGLTEKLANFRDVLFHEHGLLRRDPVTGQIVYGFIHGDWALCNARPDGHCCGVDQELPILLETGCYADFTMPSAPSATQVRTVNSIYYAKDRPGPRSHEDGPLARVGLAAPEHHLLMIQGPLNLDWSSRRAGVIPRTENGDIHGRFPPTLRRFQRWLETGVHVAGQPDWIFIKLHAHGCKDGNLESFLGSDVQQFHAELAAYRAAHPHVRVHYVTAWEMAQLVHQAEAGLARPDWDRIDSCDAPAPAATVVS